MAKKKKLSLTMRLKNFIDSLDTPMIIFYVVMIIFLLGFIFYQMRK